MGQALIPAQVVTFPDQDLSGIIKAITDLQTRVSAIEKSLTPPIPSLLYDPNCIWNKKLADNAPIHAQSAAYMTELTANLRMANAWINSNPFGVPLYFVTSQDSLTPIYKLSEPLSPVTAELLQGVNIPASMTAAAGTDGHCCIINLSTNSEYDFWQLKKNAVNGHWECQAAAIKHNVLLSDGTTDKINGWWNSATATHILLGAGLIRKSDLEKGIIPHALAFATGRANSTFVYPAKSSDGYDPTGIPSGTRFRLPPNVIINPTWHPLTKMIVAAVRDYGMIIRDTTALNGTVFYAEDTTQYNLTTSQFLAPYLDTTGNIWDVVGNKTADGQFPWSLLEACA